MELIDSTSVEQACSEKPPDHSLQCNSFVVLLEVVELVQEGTQMARELLDIEVSLQVVQGAVDLAGLRVLVDQESLLQGIAH